MFLSNSVKYLTTAQVFNVCNLPWMRLLLMTAAAVAMIRSLAAVDSLSYTDCRHHVYQIVTPQGVGCGTEEWG